MSLDTGRYQLYSALKNLQAHWEQICLQWQDSVRQEFEENIWEPLEPRVKAALAAIDRLAQVINRARQDCR